MLRTLCCFAYAGPLKTLYHALPPAQDLGYSTYFVGKFMNNFGGSYTEYDADLRGLRPAGWTDWDVNLSLKDDPLNNSMYTCSAWTKDGGSTYERFNTIHGTDVEAIKTGEMIEAAAAAGRPFFIQLSSNVPHSDHSRYKFPEQEAIQRQTNRCIPPARYASLYADVPMPRPPNFNEADTSDKPAGLNAQGQIDISKQQSLQEQYTGILRCVRGLDDALGAIVGKLEAHGLLDNTYIIYTSDNGFHAGHHKLGIGKGTPYEEDLLVPFFIRGQCVGDTNKQTKSFKGGDTKGGERGRYERGESATPIGTGHFDGHIAVVSIGGVAEACVRCCTPPVLLPR